LLYAMYCCSDIVFRKISTFYLSLRETLENISVGIKIMFSNTASMLIIGVVRIGIEHSWNVATFGKVSLTLNISNFMMIFISAVGMVMFPILRRTDEKKLPNIYETMRTFLMVILLGALIAYYPLRVILSAWLPQYADSLLYMALVFPMCVYEGKMVLLINTYLKTLRKENLMLKINLASLALSTVVSVITTVLIGNLDLAIASIFVILAFRGILAEILLSKIIKISVNKDIILELAMTFIFIMAGWFINSWITVVVYMIAYGIYLFLKQKEIRNTLINVKILMRA
jgi:O-antigen/teichoic acid export membrane protein